MHSNLLHGEPSGRQIVNQPRRVQALSSIAWKTMLKPKKDKIEMIHKLYRVANSFFFYFINAIIHNFP